MAELKNLSLIIGVVLIIVIVAGVAVVLSDDSGNGGNEQKPVVPEDDDSLSAPAVPRHVVVFDQTGFPEGFSILYVDDGSVVEPPNPTRNGMVLTGWIDDDGAPWDFNDPVHDDMILTAQWVEQIGLVTIDHRICNMWVDYAWEGYTNYVNWNDGSPAEIVPAGKPLTHDYGKGVQYYTVTVTSVGDTGTFESSYYVEVVFQPYFLNKVTFDSNGGSYVEPQTIKDNELLMSFMPPERDGYRFDCWYYKGEVWDFSTPVTSNMTLYAHWIKDPENTGEEVTVVVKETDLSNAVLYDASASLNADHFIWYVDDEIVSVDPVLYLEPSMVSYSGGDVVLIAYSEYCASDQWSGKFKY